MLSENLKKFRIQRGMTQEELSKVSGVKYTTLTKLEGGFVKEPTISNVYKIAQALQLPMEFLVSTAPSINNNTKRFDLKSRRFLGNKYKLLGFIEDIVNEKAADYQVFCDLFAGTGVVGQRFNKPGKKIISNDILLSNVIPITAFLKTLRIDTKKIYSKLSWLNNLVEYKENYFSNNFGGTYFTLANAKKIGRIREEIEVISESEEEKNILLTSLLYATDKVANTVGHYDAYRMKLDNISPVVLLFPNIYTESNTNNEVYQKDANKLIKEIICDVLYIDPPYNSRQYSDSYHLLENLVEWKKPVVYGKAKKMDRTHLKSKYCLKSAAETFKELIENANCKHILVSYNNTGEKKDGRSNARVSDIEITDILKHRGNIEIFEREYKAYTTGRSDTKGHVERIFYCKVNN